LQAGLAYQEDFGKNFFRVGRSYSYANLHPSITGIQTGNTGSLNRDLSSLSIGAALNLGEVWEFGINVSQNNRGENSHESARHGAHGITASINYNEGKWVYGGYVHSAHRGASSHGKDFLTALQVGIAYRIDTKLRVYSALYSYQLTHDAIGETTIPASNKGNVFLVGVRWTL